jgi:type II secretory pathway pseudopilin PulG
MKLYKRAKKRNFIHRFIRIFIRRRKAVTLIELLVAMVFMVIIFAVIAPQIYVIRTSWANNEASSTVIQNGRVLEEHINRNLSAAKQIVSVSPSSTTSGFIIFKDSNDVQKRYMVNDGNVVFGTVGSEAALAGPVDKFKISCYTLSDMNTPITDGNNIRFVKIESHFTNNSIPQADRTFTSSTYLETNANPGCSLVGWWKFDETSGITAADSSNNSYNGTLVNMTAPACWGTGRIGNALTFDGINDYVTLPIGSVINSLTNCTIATWVNWSGSGSSWQRILDFGTGTTFYMFLTPNNGTTGSMRFAITNSGTGGEDQTTVAGSSPLATGWHHIAVTIDATNHIHTIYLDGALVAQKTSATHKPSDLGTTTNNYLGRSQFSTDPYFNGKLDDVRIYSRVLTAAEILQLANTLKYMGFNEAKAASSLTSLSVPIPTGTTAGDLLIAAVATDGDTSTTITTAAAGWTQLDRGASSGAVTLGVWYKVAGASEPAPTFTWTTGEQAYGWIMRFTGQDATNPINASAVFNQTSATPQSPAVTTTVPNCLILRIGAFNNDDIIIDNPTLLAGHTTITADESASSAGGVGTVTYQGLQATKKTPAGTSVVVNKPTGTAAGDLLVAAVATNGDTFSYFTQPSGWTSIFSDHYSTEVSFLTWWKKAGASEPASYTFSWTTNSDEAYAWIMRFTGQDPTYPINVSNKTSGSGSSTPSSPSVTTSVANCMIVRTGGFDSSSITVGSPGLSGHTAITMDRSSTTAAVACSGGAGYMTQAAAGSSGTSAFALLASEQFVTVTFAIAPGPATGTVCGGAGYVIQSAAGSSGTANFTLGSSNEARMLTIAIAPSTTDNCSGNIKP